jgi:hypothetical protein
MHIAGWTSSVAAVSLQRTYLVGLSVGDGHHGMVVGRLDD